MTINAPMDVAAPSTALVPHLPSSKESSFTDTILAQAMKDLSTLDDTMYGMQAQMSAFTVRLESFTLKGRKTLADEKTTFATKFRETKEKQRGVSKEIETYKHREKKMEERLEREEKDIQEVQLEIADMEKKKLAKVDHKDFLLSQIEETKMAIEKKRTLRQEERKVLSSQTSRNAPELEFWEHYLGLRLDGVGRMDHLKFVYTHIDPKDPAKEFFFILDMSERDYTIVACRPKLNLELTEKSLNKINETRDLTKFLREMRLLFKNALSAHER